MKIISLTDIHGRIAVLSKMEAIIRDADLVLVTGDITHFGHRDVAKQVLDTIREINPHVLAVSGNCDYQDIDDYLTVENLSIHGKGVVKDGIGIMGVGASLPTPFNTPNEMPEGDFETCLVQAKNDLPDSTPFIMVSHQPPFETTTDKISTGVHVGSHTVRAFIDRFQPLVCFTGHIHESVGKDYIKDTVILNPGPSGAGNYAYVELNNDRVGTADIRSIPV
ncbi:MAG: metallophosphoesterase family protein [Proteobacteria bacterium]|nr:metallophosphoesterase family protein [Pseudomonadota bacterium]